MSVYARFTFLKEYAPDFTDNEFQTVVEMSFPDVSDFIDQCKSIEEYLEDVQCVIDGKVIGASDFPAV